MRAWDHDLDPPDQWECSTLDEISPCLHRIWSPELRQSSGSTSFSLTAGRPRQTSWNMKSERDNSHLCRLWPVYFTITRFKTINRRSRTALVCYMFVATWLLSRASMIYWQLYLTVVIETVICDINKSVEEKVCLRTLPMKLRHFQMNIEYMPKTGFSTCFFMEIDLPVDLRFSSFSMNINKFYFTATA